MENGLEDLKKQHLFPNEDHKLMVRDVNTFFICTLCGGYLVDATGLVECSHIYCRSCIVQFLKINSKCPVCEVSLNKEDPFFSLRPDQIMQRLVYKAIPGLYKKELLQRKLYFNSSEVDSIIISDDESTTKQYYFDPKEPISICLEYIESKRFDTEKIFSNLDEIANKNRCHDLLLHANHKRYLQCPAALRIKTLLKWIREKYSLRKNHKVEILYNRTKLPSYFSIMDVAYTFLWKRESPMCLGYQIFEQSLIGIPVNLQNTILNGDMSAKNDIMKTGPLHTPNTEEKPFKCAANFENVSRNLKHKSNTSTTDVQKMPNLSDLGFSEPTVKIPRISSSLLEDEMNEIKATNLKHLINNESPRLENRSLSNDSGLYLDDYKYEQDIEEIVDYGDNDNAEDDEDNNQLQILDIPNERHEDISQQLIIDTSDDSKESKLGDKKIRTKRKNKKSKRKHHHRRHEHKRGAPQATILQSPDTDIMKLKFKLNNIKPETRHNKQSHKRWKKPSDNYFSTSSNCSESSLPSSSPDTASSYKADDELIQLQVSELSDESNAIVSIGEKSITIPKELKGEILKKPTSSESSNITQSPTSKEKLLQMRAFRPKNIAVVKPEENDKNSNVSFPKNDDTTNNKASPPTFEMNKPKAVSTIIHPATASSITVSKITAAEKLLMEQEKKMNNNINNDKPSLEITLVTEPAKLTATAVSESSACPLSQNKNNQQSHRIMKPVPPLYQLAVRSNEANKSKTPSVQPYMKQIPLPPLPTTNIQSSTQISQMKKKVNDPMATMKSDGIKQSVTISLSGHLNHKDISSALDLSGKPYYSHSIANLTNNDSSRLLNMKSNKLIVSPSNSNYNPVNSMSSLLNNVNNHKYLPTNTYKGHIFGYQMGSSMQHNDIISSTTSILHKPKAITYPMTNMSKTHKTVNIPPLNEIQLGPARDMLPKPRPNQNVRNIPNPSHVRRRYHPFSTIGINSAMSPTLNESIEGSMMRHLPSATCSLSNYKKVAGKCSPVIPKPCVEHTNIMITK